MFKNYFFLNRLVLELNVELYGFSLTGIFTQERDKLILQFSLAEENKFIEISANPGMPFINLRKAYSRAKKNTADFHPEHLPSKLISFDISNNDRVIRIKTDNITLYFCIRGKFTNILFSTIDGIVDCFKKNEQQDVKELYNELNSMVFISNYNQLQIKDSSYTWQSIRKDFPVIGKEIIAEAQARSSQDDSADIGIVKTILKEIETEKAAVFIDETNSQIKAAVSTFTIFPHTSVELFDTYTKALNFFFSRYFSMGMADNKKKMIKKHLDRELGKVSSKLNDLQSRVASGSKEQEYNKIGNLLLMERSSIHKGMDKIIVKDFSSDEETVVKLDEKLSPQQNIDYYFEKSHNEKINYEKSKKLYNNLRKEYERLKKIEERYGSMEESNELDHIMNELKIKQGHNTPQKEDLKEKFKRYIIYNKYEVFVGRDSANNDLLTTKFARQNDYWFHARSVPGSHVVLRVSNTKEPVPKDVLKKTASLAAYHSKAKTSGMVPVSFTFKKYVSKRKGMEPGKVALLKEDVLIVKPEIPAGCEYID